LPNPPSATRASRVAASLALGLSVIFILEQR
jgi:hypothetical protein